MPTRRRFLLNCSAIATAASIAPARLFSAPIQWADTVSATPLDTISFEEFSGLVGTTFRVHGHAGRVIGLRLTKAKPQALPASADACAPDAHHEKFSLLFAGSPEAALPEHSCVFEHERIGRFTMFISPVGLGQPGVRHYEACFNRPVVAGRSSALGDVQNSPLASERARRPV
jgi:hypothetical protein